MLAVCLCSAGSCFASTALQARAGLWTCLRWGVPLLPLQVCLLHYLVLFCFCFLQYMAVAVELELLSGGSSLFPSILFIAMHHLGVTRSQAQSWGRSWRAAAEELESGCLVPAQVNGSSSMFPLWAPQSQGPPLGSRGCRQAGVAVSSQLRPSCLFTYPSEQTVLSKNPSGRKEPSVLSLLLENQFLSLIYCSMWRSSIPPLSSVSTSQAVPVISSCSLPHCCPCRSSSAPLCNLQ